MNYASVTDDGQVFLEKDAPASLSYLFKLDQVLGAGDSLSAVTAVVAPAGALTVLSTTVAGTDLTAVLQGGAPGTWYALNFTWTSLSGQSDEFLVRVYVPLERAATPQLGSALFPNRFTATSALRRDRLMLAASGAAPAVKTASDDFLWEKLLTAEATIKHALRVPLTPTKFFAAQPTPAQIAALGTMPWAVDPGYDYEPDFFGSDRWGFMRLRHRPLVSVDAVRISFPGTTYAYAIPSDWIRFEKAYADVQFVPISGGGSIPLNAFMLQVIGMGRRIPFAIAVEYTAGIENAQADYPDLIDAVRKQAVLSLLEDLFLPQSGSISADGLSQSVSVDMDKYRDTIDHILNGPKGRNGGLMAKLHGIRLGSV